MKKRSIFKKLTSMFLAAGMILSSFATTGAAVSAADGFNPDANLLAHYPLEADVDDVSGNDQDATIIAGATGIDFAGDALNLAGGGSSSPNYVTLPDGLFDEQDTVTVSLWINNNGTQGNYAAFFFGSAAVNNLPQNYFLLNPTNPNGNYKAVLTNSVNASAPWNTERGINDSTSTSGFMNQWKLYTVVIDGSDVTAYLDGKNIGTTNWGQTVSDFGTGLKAHIGKSQYLEDSLFTGSFRDLRIYDVALDDADVKAVYDLGVARNKLLEDKTALSIGNTASIYADLTLPTTGANGSVITWKSDNTAAVGNDGKVTVGQTQQTANLTATLTLDGVSVTKVFEVTVVSASGVEDSVKDSLQIPYAITADTVLPSSVGDINITWDDKGAGVIAEDGTITAPEESKEITVTAKVTYAGISFEKEMKVYVMEADSEYVMSYTRSGVNAALGGSLHLAISADGKDYLALHSNTGLFFPKADLTTSVEGTTKSLTAPYLFRMADGKIGVVAARNDGKFIFAETEDLLAYEEHILSLNSNVSVREPRCEYNGEEYVITWEGSNGKTYKNTTKDFKTISDPEEIGSRTDSSLEVNISNAVPCNMIPVTKAEAENLRIKLQELENTGIVEKEYEFYVLTGEELTEEDTKSTITAQYNDGTTDEIPVVWDMSGVDYDTPGEYTIKGQAKLTEYPVLNGRADPNIVKYNDKYYFIATGETQSQSQVCIREADTPLGLFSARDYELIPNQGHPNWAPELHEIEGKLYIFIAIGSAWNRVQCSIMELKEGGDPTNKNDWMAAQRVMRDTGENLYDEGITLDMTYFEHDGDHYVCWAQRYIGSPNGTSDLWIATIDPEDPYTIISDPVCILPCQYGWDRVDATVDEGPFIIKNEGKIYMTFSGAATGNLYVVGLLTADEDADLLDPDSWKETNYPILTSESVPGELGPGHSCFCVDEDGRDIFVYHMRPNGGTRSATVRRVHWAPDGSPVLDMTIDQELKAEYRTVTGVVKVVDEMPQPIVLPYEDVTEADWFYEAVEYTFINNLMTGMDATHFGPYGQLSRAQFALILHRMEGEAAVETDKTFGDITGDEWYGPAVLWAAENGIVTGYQDGNFGPADMITREQMAVMMYRYAKYLGQDVTADADFTNFTDAASVSEFAAEAMKWAVGNGIITGKEGGTLLDPQGNTARSEAAIIIQRFMEK